MCGIKLSVKYDCGCFTVRSVNGMNIDNDVHKTPIADRRNCLGITKIPKNFNYLN